MAKGHNGTIWVFHRGDRDWQEPSSTSQGKHAAIVRTPIAGPTVMQLDQDTGKASVAICPLEWLIEPLVTNL